MLKINEALIAFESVYIIFEEFLTFLSNIDSCNFFYFIRLVSCNYFNMRFRVEVSVLN